MNDLPLLTSVSADPGTTGSSNDGRPKPRIYARRRRITRTVHSAWQLLWTAYRIRRGGHVLPRILTFTVTFGCNARCVMCDSWKLPTSDDLTIDDIERIFLQMPRLDVVRLTGGEPFLRPDFPTIVELAQELLQPLAMHITTNGFLTSRIVRMVEERDSRTPLILLISIDGVGDKHNQVRGSTIAWKRVTETLTELAPLQAGRNVRLAVNQTFVDAEAPAEYRRLRDFLRPLGIPHQVVFAYETSATYNTTRELNLAPASLGEFPFRAGLKADDLQSLMDELHRDVRRLPWLERLAKRYYLRGIFQRLLHGQADPCPPCVALQAHLRLFPNGDVPTCQFNGQGVGNLKRQSFLDVWNSLATTEQRDWVRNCPGCWAECEVLPSALYSLDIARSII